MSTSTTDPSTRFALPSRLLHWSMAAMVVVQLFIAAVMMASLAYRPLLLSLHKTLGIVILLFVLIRIGNRLLHRPPPFMSTMGPLERLVAKGSEYLLYALLLVQPLVGWATLSAAGEPIVIFAELQLPAIGAHNTALFAVLRQAHWIMGYLLFATFTAHMCAVLLHTLVLRDKLLSRMALWPARKATAPKADRDLVDEYQNT